MPRERKTINIEIGKRIQSRRVELGYTREELAVKSKYTQNFIKEAEHGRSGLSSESIRAFSLALNVSTDYLLFGAPSEASSNIYKKIDSVPEEKLPLVLHIIDELIECAK